MENLESFQDDLLQHLRDNLPAEVVEQSVPDAKSVRRSSVNGEVIPYYAIQFGDLQAGGARSMAGARGDDYQIPFYVVCIAGEASLARRLYNRLLDHVLGKGFRWTGDVRKRPGGAMFTMTQTDASTEAYAFPASFSVLI